MKKKAPIPETVEQALDALDKLLKPEDKKFLLENGAISAHHTLGRWIRNEWGLWNGSKLKALLEERGYSHPDDMSNHILECYVNRLIVHDTVDNRKGPRDNWEYIQDFCLGFGRLPKDMDELDALVSYVIDRRERDAQILKDFVNAK